MLSLSNKNLVIIGGTSGIGLSAAKAFIAQGANVVVTGRDDEHAPIASKLLGEKGKVIIRDACQQGSAEEAINACVEQYDFFDGIYHVAGGSGRSFGDGPLHELTLEGWNKTFELNMTSIMLSNQAAIRHFLLNKKTGTILNTTSVLAYSPSPNFFSTHAYSAAKSATIGFTKSIAAYYANDNIRVNAIAPSLVESPMSQRALNNDAIMNFIKVKQPLDGGRIGQPQDLDGLAIYFMSDYSKFTTGQIIAVDGGWDGGNA